MSFTRVVSVLVLAAFGTAGCGLLFNSKTRAVSMASEPSGADVYVDGARVGTTPMAFELNIKTDHVIAFRMDGHKEVSCTIDRSVGAGWVVLDILGGLIPLIIDAATGSWYGLGPKVCNVTMPVEGGQ